MKVGAATVALVYGEIVYDSAFDRSQFKEIGTVRVRPGQPLRGV